jgi:glutaconate CoA-transferase subunit A
VPIAAHPSYTQGCYDRDNRFYIEWEEISKSPQSTQQWLDEWVYGVKDRAEYWEKLGAEAHERLKVQPMMSQAVNYGAF